MIIAIQKQIMRRVALILFCCLGAFAGNTQVLPPDFLCIRSDSLFWNPTLNSCGPFQSYDIYFSENSGGPFTLLDQVSNPAQLHYFHPNSINQERYYYLESNHDCPGETVIPSLILNNRPPAVPRLESVSVEGDQVEVTWSPSSSAATSGYIIYRTTALGTLPVDTVAVPNTTYLDINANPTDQIETYFVVATDPCGNNSNFGSAHFTMFLQESVDPCTQTINLTWNKYRNWINGIGDQKVWLSINNGPEELVATLDSSSQSFAYENALKGQIYSFYIEASHAGTNFTAKSNAVVIVPQLIQGVRDLVLKNVSVRTDDQIQLNWTWNTDAEIKDIAFSNALQNSGYTQVGSQNPSNPLLSENFYLESMVNPSVGKQYFRVTSTDLCDSTFQSNYGSTIFLSGSPQSNLTNLIRWTPYDIEGGQIIDYELYRIVNGQESFVETIDPSQNTFSDPVDPENSFESEVCYYLFANASYELLDGSIQNLQSRSNLICVQQNTNIFVPNAFVPSGLNSQFKPVLVFGENVSYQMVILDRWGGKLFETADIDEGWTGRNGLRLVPGGAYTYVIKVVQSNGVKIEKSGVFLLIR